MTASIGIAQLCHEELAAANTQRVTLALEAAKAAGGNVCFRHDGEACHPVSSAFQSKAQREAEETMSLAALWRDATSAILPTDNQAGTASPVPKSADGTPELSGRSLFAANLTRRLAEWKRGGASVSVALLRVDQIDGLVNRFGEKAQGFIRQVMGRLMEATTREMDERCEFEDGLFALILPNTDEPTAIAIADRLCAQVRQCKVRIGNDLWSLTASIGVTHCSVTSRVMDIILSAEAALLAAAERGGDAVRIGEAVQDPLASVPR